ncbi:hypothetical protein [Winogradskyella thalassocola]|uniref:Type IV secretory pathway, VirB3-like protein n=1 Tax=Winogradskyella thalassocola TaxID=262004 RepID=A0A1G8JAJ7_9FLAO|nr:hypothetical protein [Winogradskyella thalassocola]SDI27650.1 hypothetical protein SAMN04489796_10912 [Winogradskyella thalassocola]
MKRFEVYKNIRKRAAIFGLPISLFALMMVAILASLLIIIFSFSFGVIIGLMFFNASLYVALTRITNHPQLFQMTKAFPKLISNKRISVLNYEHD